MRVGIIGVGRWGKNLARNFHELGVLGAVCDHEKQALYPGISRYEKASMLLEDPRITQVIIATPPSSHYQLAKEALLLNKDVFVEKPLCFSTQEATELLELANRKKCILMVGHLLQFHPCIVSLKEMIQMGKLGNLCSIEAIRFTPQPSHVSALWDLGPHDVSLILGLCQASPQEITYEEENDRCHLTLRISDVLKAEIFLETGKGNKQQNLTIVGSKATAVFSSNQTLTVTPGETIFSEEEVLRRECEHFMQCCRNRTVPLTDGQEALLVTQVLEQAEKNTLIRLS